MTRVAAIAISIFAMLAAAEAMRAAQSQPQESSDAHRESGPAIRFATVSVMLDPEGAPLAAYQVEVKATRGDVKIVGIEGGEHAAYGEPPYYDPAAMRQERVIIGAFSTAAAASLPATATRIATIHLQITGDVEPTFATDLMAAATTGGKPIKATIQLKTGPSR